MRSNNTQIIDENWFRLDNAGKLYPSIASSRVSTIYRLTAVLKHEVNVDCLQKALEISISQYPMFNVRLRKGIFWYYFEKVDDIPLVLRERYYPCTSINMKESQVIPYKLLYFNNKIHLEMSHAIADGYGSLTFLRSILRNYYDLLGKVEPDEILTKNAPNSDELEEFMEDAFQKYYEKGVPSPPKIDRAYHFPFELIPKGEYSVTYGTFKNEDFKRLAKKYNTTQNKMMLCLFFEALQEYMEEGIKSKKIRRWDIKPIVVNAPVNLRGIFPSKTLRNFFISITPAIDVRLGHYSREEILAYLDQYFAICTTEKYLKRFISRNFKNQLFLHVRLIPLFIKNFILPIFYSYYGESNFTSSVSNLGAMKIEEPWGDMVEKFYVLPPPSEGNLLKSVVVTHNALSTISFGSLTANKTIETILFRKLVAEGIPMEIETNY